MPLTLPQKTKTLAQELKEMAQNGSAGRDTADSTVIAEKKQPKREPIGSTPDITLFRSIMARMRDAPIQNGSIYLQPTNGPAIRELNNLGVDASKINKEFFERNAALVQYARIGMNGLPVAPQANSSREEKAGYYYVKLLNAENQTVRAEAELAGLNREISYWAGRADRNYSDEEITKRIDWKKYPTLNVMREGLNRGRPVPLNRGVDFNDDTLNGMLWSARNGKDSESHTLDAMKYALGVGNTYRADPKVKAKMDPESRAYNPYALGSTVDEAAEYFGMNGFDQKWLNDNQAILKSGDETAIKHYRQVYDAEQVTKAAEDETRNLSERLSARLKNAYSAGGTVDANFILKDALFGLETLQKMDEGRVSGNLLKLNRPVNYSWQNIVKSVNDQVQGINARQNAPFNTAELDIAARNEEKKVLREQGTLIQNEAVPKSYTSFHESMPGLWAVGLTQNPLSAGWYVPGLAYRHSYKTVYKDPNVRPQTEWRIPVIPPEQWDGMTEEEKKSVEARYWETVLVGLQGKQPGELSKEETRLFDTATAKLSAYYNPQPEKQADPHAVPPVYKREGDQDSDREDTKPATPAPVDKPHAEQTPGPASTEGPTSTPAPTPESTPEPEKEAKTGEPEAEHQPTVHELEYEKLKKQFDALEAKIKNGTAEDQDFTGYQQIGRDMNLLAVMIRDEQKREEAKLRLEAEKARVAEAIAPFNAVIVPEGYHTQNRKLYDLFEKYDPIPDDELSTWVHEGNWEALFRVADLWTDEAGITRLGKTVMSGYEKSRYYYICDIMGKYKGEEYLKLLMDHKLNERIAQTVYQKGEELAEIAPFAASLMSVEGNLAASAYGLAALGKGIIGQAAGKFDPLFIAGDTSGIMRSTVAGNLDDTGALFYQVGMSITDMMASRVISVGTGLPIISSLMMAGQAGGSTMSRVLKSDGTMDQALALGFVSTALSGITESLEMDRFLGFLKQGTLGKGMKQLFVGLAEQTFAQGIPEGMEEFIEWGGNMIADYYGRVDESHISQVYQANMDTFKGDEGKAWSATVGQLALEAKDEFLGGALAGAFFGDLGVFGNRIRSIAMGDGGKNGFNPDQAKTQAIADSRKAGDFGAAAAQGYDVLTKSGSDISQLTGNEGAARLAIDLALDGAKAFIPEQIASPETQNAAARQDTAVNTILGIDPDAVAKIQPLITDAATVQSDAKKQPDGTTGLLSTILKLDEDALNTVTVLVLGGNPSLQTAQTMFRLLRLKNMEAGMQTKAFETAEAALFTAAGSKLQTANVSTGDEELDDLISVATQSPDYLDITRKRWGTQGLNYLSSLITLGRGDLAAAIVAMPTYAKSTIIAETNMRTFGLNDAAIAAQENALKADMKSLIVVASAKQITKLQAVEARKTELIAGGALGDQSALVQQMNAAGKTLDQSKSVYDQAVRKEQAGRNTLVLAQAAFHQNMADTNVADALVDAIANLQNASGERRKAEQAMKAGRQALNDAKRKLTDAQKQAMEKVTAQAKQDVEVAIRNRMEERTRFQQQAVGEAGVQGTVRFDHALSENVSNEEKEGNPLAPGNGNGIMGEGTQGESGSANEKGDPDEQSVYIDKLIKKSSCSCDDLYRYLYKVNGDYAKAYSETGRWPTDIQIPKSPDALNTDGSINWAKALKGGYVLDSNGDAIKTPYKPEIGEVIDRYGPTNGRFTTPIKNNKPCSYDQRSLPYLEDVTQYHSYTVIGDFSKLEQYVNSCSNANLKNEIYEYVDVYYGGDFNKITIYKGEIAGIVGWGSGGGIQYELPFAVEWLEAIGILQKNVNDL